MAALASTAMRGARAASSSARPMSPHLGIYTFKQNMATSVLFRGTGIFMTGGLGALAIAGLLAPKPYKHYVHTLQTYPLLNGLVKFGIAFPLSYHFAGGLRHLAWDNLVGHNTPAINSSGRLAVAAAVVISVAAAATEFQ